MFVRSTSLATALAVLAGSSLLLPAAPSVLAQEMAQAAQAAPSTVNINTADAETLAGTLSGIGLSRAEEIIRYREAYGPFKSIDELADVKGIGPATLDKNRAVITLE
ncbi:helix-hairpin-helix domain-containing protein [Parahaliea mediterranea]|uniref:Helix-hairpin-helix domain-containing protein n=2 Tax=Parahaliea mediterranea TaxID=651086 RepID=A0A939DIV3_9GAMM|nr:helix-hairpin-helix domain-containing protein [Parahaliea mediterranea]